MGQLEVDKFQIKVPTGEGHLIGDMLRKYATRSVGSWQIIGYHVLSSATNFGFSNGATVSYLELLKGTVHTSVPDAENLSVRRCILAWNGECFSGDGFDIYGLTHGIGDTIEACFLFAKGYRTAEENYEVLRDLFGEGSLGLFAVPSAHSVVHTFKYTVEPYDTMHEWLNIEADRGVADAAYRKVFNTLNGIDI